MRHLALIAMVGLLPGCATYFNTGDTDKFVCPGIPKGVSCKTPREAYDLSTQGVAVVPPTAADGSITGALRDGAGDEADIPAPAAPAAATAAGLIQMARRSEPRAVREPATVMRIKVFPWVDGNDDLHMGSVLFTEIQGRRWSFGKSVPAPVVIRGRPLEDTDPDADARPGANPAGSPANSSRPNPGLLPRGGARGDL